MAWYCVEVEYRVRETVFLHADSLRESKTKAKDQGNWEDNMDPYMVLDSVVVKSAKRNEN